MPGCLRPVECHGNIIGVKMASSNDVTFGSTQAFLLAFDILTDILVEHPELLGHESMALQHLKMEEKWIDEMCAP